MTDLPPGFVLEQISGGAPALPSGFVPASQQPPGSPSGGGGLSNIRLSQFAKGLYNAAISGLTLPGDVYSGKVDPSSDEAIRRSVDLAGFATPVNPMVRAGDRALPGVAKAIRSEKPIPTAEQLREAATANYAAARESGVEIASDSVRKVASAMQQRLEQEGIFDTDAPRTFANLRRLQDAPPESFARVEQLESARKAFGHAAGDFKNPTEQLAASQTIRGMDDYLSSIDPADVLAGSPTAASEAFTRARGNYAAASRSDSITGALERADLNAAVANSGQNVDNAIRQRMRDILVKPKDSRGFSPEELAAVEQVARGSAATNISRGAGNLLGGGGGLGGIASGVVGAATTSAAGLSPFLGAVAPVIGYGAKKVANALTKRAANRADEMVRMRSPLYEEGAPIASVVSPEARALVMRALIESQNRK